MEKTKEFLFFKYALKHRKKPDVSRVLPFLQSDNFLSLCHLLRLPTQLILEYDRYPLWYLARKED